MRTLLAFSLLVACGGAAEDTEPAGPAPGPFSASMGDPDDCAPSAALKLPTGRDFGTWAVGRITPPGYPARVDEVIVQFDHRVPCTVAIPGLVRVFVDGDVPSDEPGVIRAGEVEAADANTGSQQITLDLGAAPPRLEQGQHLYVMARSEGQTGAMRCLTLCQQRDQADEAFWSDRTEQPYGWTPMNELGIVGAPAMRATGEILAE
jgi:hypothetical protein